MERFDWETRSAFVDRSNDLSALEQWWSSRTRDALAMIGRRRVGKSWLVRRFADGKPAVILVADRRLATTQMERFSKTLEPMLGVVPDLPDLRTLIEVVYRMGREQKILVVIDEFPYLLPEGEARHETLTEVQATMEEERDRSRTKLILCGSLIGQMRALLERGSPLHGRLQEFDVWPMDFAESSVLREPGEAAADQISRFAVAGGMARYLAELGRGGTIADLVCGTVLNRRGPLFNDPRSVLEQELRAPALSFSILEELALMPAQTDRLATGLRLETSQIWPTLHTLGRMRLVESSLPIGAPDGSRSYKHRIIDGFIRFWFRFVFRHQEALQAGLRTRDLWTSEIEPQLADFVSPTFEELCRRYTRIRHGAKAPRVGGWWGPALNKHRRAKRRFTEEVDVVGAHHKRLKVIGECKWSSSPMGLAVLEDLREFKIPAIAEEGRLKVPASGRQVILFSKTGFTEELETVAADDPAVSLIRVEELVDVLS